MERLGQRHCFLILLGILTVGLTPASVQAGVVLASPQMAPSSQSDEDFPESHFGMPDGSAGVNPVGRMPSSIGDQNPKPSSASRTGIQEVAVIAGDLGFFPKTVFVAKDIPVRMFITGVSKRTLCIMMDFFQVRKQINSQKKLLLLPLRRGSIDFTARSMEWKAHFW